MERLHLKDKVAIVTGAGQGIGRAIALRLAGEGADLVINDISKEASELVARESVELGRKALPMVADVSKKTQIKELVSKAKAYFQQIHILVNNAGIDYRSSLIEHREDKWDRVLEINLKGPFLLCQAIVPSMIDQKWGRIINISSMAYKGMGGQVAYDASKGGLNALTKSLALDLARYNITVNAVCPSWVNTPIIQSLGLDEMKEKLIKRMPMRRLANPEEIAAVVCFLATDDASYISGQNIDVNGAWFR